MMNFNNIVPMIALIKPLINIGVSVGVDLNIETNAHIVITGSTGSGKTVFSKIMLGKICNHIKDSELYILDFKGGEDFEFCRGQERFYRYMDCVHGLNEVFERLQNRQKGIESSNSRIVLFFDELSAFLNSLDKKQAEECRKKISTILMTGRSFKINLIAALQRADSAHFFAGARDNFTIAVGLGNLSSEAVDMLFSDYKEKIKATMNKQGEGYMLIDGTGFFNIIVPKIKDFQYIHQSIIQGLTRM